MRVVELCVWWWSLAKRHGASPGYAKSEDATLAGPAPESPIFAVESTNRVAFGVSSGGGAIPGGGGNDGGKGGGLGGGIGANPGE